MGENLEAKVESDEKGYKVTTYRDAVTDKGVPVTVVEKEEIVTEEQLLSDKKQFETQRDGSIYWISEIDKKLAQIATIKNKE